jgi:hypothetical protein
MTSEIEILHPVTELKINSETVEVRELRWAHALEFLRKLSAHVGKLVSVTSTGQIAASLDMDKLVAVITGAEDLAAYLVEKSTGKDANWLNELSVSDAVTVLDAALALNLSEDLLKKVSALGQRFAVVMPGAKVTASPSTTIS